jgi:hypothetical protein
MGDITMATLDQTLLPAADIAAATRATMAMLNLGQLCGPPRLSQGLNESNGRPAFYPKVTVRRGGARCRFCIGSYRALPQGGSISVPLERAP